MDSKGEKAMDSKGEKAMASKGEKAMASNGEKARNLKEEKAMASKREKARASKRENAMQVVTNITGVPDAIAGIMAEYLAVDYLSDKSVHCANFRECRQNVCFRHLDKGRYFCRKCDREWEALESAYADDDDWDCWDDGSRD